MYAYSRDDLLNRVGFLADRFNVQLKKGLGDARNLDYSIKWSSALKTRSQEIGVSPKLAIPSLWRPFVKLWFYSEKDLSDRLTANHYDFYGAELTGIEPGINLSAVPNTRPFMILASTGAIDYHATGDTVSLPFRVFDDAQEPVDNITDWALKQFKDRYKAGNTDVAALSTPSSPRKRGSIAAVAAKELDDRHAPLKSASRLREDDEQKPGNAKARAITKQAIFHYVYAVLHDPVYRETYAQNLKREFPRIPFYEDFWQWSAWGEQLMALHLGYETLTPWPLVRTDIPDEKARLNGVGPKAMLKADKDIGRIALDSETTLAGIPPAAWTYKLGNRSALEWILDQYKEKKPRDPTIRAKFDTYHFADYKDHVIDLLARVTRVSVETQAIVAAMREATR